MERRDFVRLLGCGLTAALSGGLLSFPLPALAASESDQCLAFLSDAHLKNGEAGRPEARALARAVAELRLLAPAPDLVLFAGDLAHDGDPAALALGKEILSDLPAPVFMVMGEGDGPDEAAAPWPRLFGDPWFSHVLPKTGNRKPKTVIIGLHTAFGPGPGGPLFRLGGSGRRRLARELEGLDPEAPLLILSHAPLDPVFRPWQQWTADAPEALALLSRFRQVICLHGHTHNAEIRGRGSVASKSNDFGEVYTENGERKTENVLHLSLPATAWPGPLALQGTPARLSPGLGPGGCGWGLLSLDAAAIKFQPQIWQA
jgi:3',5'-cyclic-AMP phosphodiesterase